MSTAADTNALSEAVKVIQQWLDGIANGDPGAAEGLSDYLGNCDTPDFAYNAYNTAIDSFNHKLGGDIVNHVTPPAPNESLQHYVEHTVAPQITNVYNEIHETNVDASNNVYNTGTIYGGVTQESDPTVATDGGFAQGGHDNTNTAENTNTGDVGGDLNQADHGSNAGSPGGVANEGGTQTGVNTGDGGVAAVGSTNVAGGHFGDGNTVVQNSDIDHSAVGGGATNTDSHDTTVDATGAHGDVTTQGGEDNTQDVDHTQVHEVVHETVELHEHPVDDAPHVVDHPVIG